MDRTVEEEVLSELEKDPIRNSLLIFDLRYEKSEAVKLHAFDSKNFMIIWDRLELPDATIRAESEKNVKELADLIKDQKSTFNVISELAGTLEKRSDLKKENWLLYTTDRKNFINSSSYDVEELEPSQENVNYIASQWKYSNGADFVAEKMSRYPFFGIKVAGKLVSCAGVLAHTDKIYFGGFAMTDENFRRIGMMRSVTSALAEKAFEDSKVPAMYIVEDNIPSRKSVEKLGFRDIATHAKFYPTK